MDVSSGREERCLPLPSLRLDVEGTRAAALNLHGRFRDRVDREVERKISDVAVERQIRARRRKRLDTSRVDRRCSRAVAETDDPLERVTQFVEREQLLMTDLRLIEVQIDRDLSGLTEASEERHLGVVQTRRRNLRLRSTDSRNTSRATDLDDRVPVGIGTEHPQLCTLGFLCHLCLLHRW